VLSIFNPLSYLGIIYNSMMNSVTDLQNLSDLLAAAADIVDAPNALTLKVADASKGVTLEFRDVSFNYPTAPNQGLKHVSFTVPCGTTTAIVGPTGSGKTTISRLLFRFYDALEGSVLIDGHDVRDCTQKSVRQLIGVVPQDTVLFNESVQYNIRYGRLDATDEEVEDAARRAKVHESIAKFELGYQSICGERGLKLSGGEKQRIAIARCLLKNPPVVLLDEATSALDNKTERDVQEAMGCLRGRTTLVIAHRLSTVQRAEQIIVLKDGEIIEKGTHVELLARNGLYFEMWNAQVGLPDGASPTSSAAVLPMPNPKDE
jgi:ABC-type transport system involved in Fe-S cluster assembly fused permease/ATPase subunit